MNASRSQRRITLRAALALAMAGVLIVADDVGPGPKSIAVSATRKKTAGSVVSVVVPVNVQLANDVTGGRPIVRQGTVASLGANIVSVGGVRQVSIADLATEALQRPREVRTQVASARTALFADPVESEEVKETSDATIFTSRMDFTVVDRTAVSAAVPSLGKFRPKSIRLNSLSASQRRAFDSYKVTLGSKPNGHPLKVASAQSDQALLDALSDGKADVSITTTIRVEKGATPQTGKFALAGAAPAIKFGPLQAADADDSANPPAPSGAKGTATGEVNNTAKFLTGWSLGDSLHWSDRIDLGVAWVELGFHAGYTFGLRVPVEMKGTMTPKEISRNGSGAFADDYTVKIDGVAAVDGDLDHYKVVGLEADKRADGAELAFEAGAYAFAKGSVFGAEFNERFPANAGFNESQNMRPPYGNCSVECGLNYFLPSSLTHTGINVAGIVVGEGLLGINVGGSGVVSYGYESLVNGAVVSSTRTSTGETKQKHRVRTNGLTGVSNRFKTSLPESSIGQVKFGYRLSDPNYEWTVALTPIVKAQATIDYVFGEEDLVLGPYPLPVSITLGTITLPTHAGTQLSVDKVDGVVKTDLRAGAVDDVVTGPIGSAAPRELADRTATTTTKAGGRRRKKATTTTVAPTAVNTPGSRRRKKSAAAPSQSPLASVPATPATVPTGLPKSNPGSRRTKKRAAAT